MSFPYWLGARIPNHTYYSTCQFNFGYKTVTICLQFGNSNLNRSN